MKKYYYDTQIISVIIPVYNCEAYLSRCLNSVINQSYLNLQIILIDDGSTDGSGMICEQYAEKDKRIRVIHQENGGVGKARNRGLKEVTGEWVAFIDSDDWIHSQYFEIMMKCQETSDADVVMVRSTRTAKFIEEQIIFTDCLEYSSMTIYEILSDVIAKTRIWGRIYRASLIEGVRFPESVHLGEDTCFNLKAILSCEKCNCIMITKAMYFYFDRNDSLVHTADYNDLFEVAKWYIEQVNQEIENEENKYLWAIEACKALLAFRYLSMFDISKKEKCLQCNKKLRECIEVIKSNKKAERFYYKIMYRFPLLYRIYRICTDRTMLAWEKKQKKGARNRERY